MTPILAPFVLVSIALFGVQLHARAEAPPSSELDKPADWSRIIRGFRREHNFALSVGRSLQDWRGVVPDREESFSFSSETWQLDIGYSFHLPLRWGLGYTLGTQTGLGMATTTDSHRIGYLLNLPGWEIGLVANLNERWRILATAVYSWQRIDSLRLPRARNVRKIAVTGDTVAYRWAIDYFYDLDWGLRMEAEIADFSYDSAETLKLQKSARIFRLAVVKHLL